jgi:hypothetical protein
MYDQQFRLRKSLNPTRPWSQVDGVLWLRFIAKGASGIQNVNSYNNPQQRKCEKPSINCPAMSFLGYLFKDSFKAAKLMGE